MATSFGDRSGSPYARCMKRALEAIAALGCGTQCGQFATLAVTCEIVGNHSTDGLMPAY